MCRWYCVVFKDVNVVLRIEVFFNFFYKICFFVWYSVLDSYFIIIKFYSWYYVIVFVFFM